DPFGFGTLHYIKNVNDSKKLNQSKEPCVIISASGMMEAGRVKHHLANNIENPANSVLAVGYCAPLTLGAKILSGQKDISIFGNPHHVKADVFKIDAFSGHGDYKEMTEYLQCQQADKLQQLFLVHGDEEARKHYARILKKKGFNKIVLPAHQEEFELKPV
ncbi:MAG TPA: MBL fold metallo-hydrolase RNA specificity domain-containing protein, partial [Bacteroidales bacterium]|nr:MBL fold metallo-hydrolase RNA specificity domain-containing protein [Bacteroidales bacterium]